MRLKDAFHGVGYGEEKKPMGTIQKQINRRPHISSKFYRVAKAYKGGFQTGRKPSDIRPRFKEKISTKKAFK